MNQDVITVDLVKLFKHLLKRCWIILLCAAVGFFGMFTFTEYTAMDTYTAAATLYVKNANPNMINYAYADSNDLNSAVALLDIYKVVINSNKVMDAVAERLKPQYEFITPEFITECINVSSVEETGVTLLRCTTTMPTLSRDICNAVADVAPAEIIRVVGAGDIAIVDYAEEPTIPNRPNAFLRGLLGGFAAALITAALLAVCYILNQKVRDAKELTDRYNVPLLAELPRRRRNPSAPYELLVNETSGLDLLEAYNKLRMNLGFALVDKRPILLVSGSVPGEGKSTVAANLAITCARCGRRVLLIDSDMRRSTQCDLFFRKPVSGEYPGLSNLIIRECTVSDVINYSVVPNLDVMLAGSVPPNPSELLSSSAMSRLLTELEQDHRYDMIILDMPPVNIVPDPLILAGEGVSMLFVVRQKYSDHREIRKALSSIEFSGMNLAGMVFYGENLHTDNSYRDRSYTKYYSRYYKKHGPKDPSSEAYEKWALHTDTEGIPAQPSEAPEAQPEKEENA